MSREAETVMQRYTILGNGCAGLVPKKSRKSPAATADGHDANTVLEG
jgi:hypothetical protein